MVFTFIFKGSWGHCISSASSIRYYQDFVFYAMTIWMLVTYDIIFIDIEILLYLSPYILTTNSALVLEANVPSLPIL